MVQRASELPRRGITDEQIRFAALAKKLVTAYDDFIICRVCKAMFKNPIFGKYPSACIKCGVKFDEKGNNFMPDLVLDKDGKRAVVFIHQKWGKKAPHQKRRVQIKDEDQVEWCRQNGMKVFVVWNETINNSPDMNLKFLILGMWKAMDDDILYQSIVKEEKDELLVTPS